MANSNITKKALAQSLKELGSTKILDKITVADITNHCGVNRQTFYYHFKDKYDLVNWIYDTEFIFFARQKAYLAGWEFLSDLCHYLYENKEFYRRALKISGQNSFSEHFKEMLYPVISEHVKEILDDEMKEFHINFFSDALLCSIERWLLEKDCIPADEFLNLLRSCIYSPVLKIYESMEDPER